MSSIPVSCVLPYSSLFVCCIVLADTRSCSFKLLVAGCQTPALLSWLPSPLWLSSVSVCFSVVWQLSRQLKPNEFYAKLHSKQLRVLRHLVQSAPSSDVVCATKRVSLMQKPLTGRLFWFLNVAETVQKYPVVHLFNRPSAFVFLSAFPLRLHCICCGYKSSIAYPTTAATDTDTESIAIPITKLSLGPVYQHARRGQSGNYVNDIFVFGFSWPGPTGFGLVCCASVLLCWPCCSRTFLRRYQISTKIIFNSNNFQLC